jgi:hypothetical protein
METNNSYGSIYCQMVCDLYRDIAQCYGVDSKTERIELGVIRDRFCREGVSFLTKQLPRFGKALDSALSKGTLLSIEGFKKPPGSAIPKLFGWLTSKVLDVTGRELDTPCPIALKHFRQLVYFLYKLEIPYEANAAQAVIDTFIQTEADIKAIKWAEMDDKVEDWINGARDFVTRVVSPLDPTRIKPRHGPGAVATGESTLKKSFFKRIYSKLEPVYPFMEWMRFNLNHVAQSWEADQNTLILEERATAKVVLVPKDSRGPRLISCEPLEIQWIQQGLGRALQKQIEESRWTVGHVNFTDQTINRRLALVGSLHSQWVTLDMKEASDRVSVKLVERLFNGHPFLLQAMMACRSEATLLPNGTELPLDKFAPMGSCLCFPVESLVFYALAVSAIRQQTGKSWRKAMKSVYVYGDDIIVRREDYPHLLSQMPKVGLMFNDGKCCTARFFRESCGCDAYVGVDVTPVRLKTLWSHRRSDPNALVSYVALYNAMYGLGYHSVAETTKQLVTETYGYIPHTNNYSVAPNGAYCSNANAIAFVCHEPADRLNLSAACEARKERDKRLEARERYLSSLSGRNQRLPRNNGHCHMRKCTPVSARTRYNRDLQVQEYLSYASVSHRERQEPIHTCNRGYAEMLRRYSAGYGPHGGVYAIARRNRLKRAWLS